MDKVYLIVNLVLLVITGCQTSNKVIERDANFVAILENQNGIPHLRPAFSFKEGGWSPIMIDENRDLPKDWNVQYEGVVLGQVNVKINDTSLNEVFSWQKPEQKINSKFLIEKNKERFVNWMGVPKYRPLLATEGNNVKVSSGIVEGKLSREIVESVLTEFRKKSPTFTLCDSPASNKVLNEKSKYTDRDIKLDTVIKLQNESYLVGVVLDNKLNLCDGPPESVWFEHWFYVQNKDEISFLGSNMYPVDKIDSQALLKPWIFSTSGYNQDGYILFYDDFQKSVSISWKYH